MFQNSHQTVCEQNQIYCKSKTQQNVKHNGMGKQSIIQGINKQINKSQIHKHKWAVSKINREQVKMRNNTESYHIKKQLNIHILQL